MWEKLKKEIHQQLSLVALLIITIYSSISFGQDYPNRTIKLVVPYGAGGAADQFGRIIGERLSKELNQSIIIENIAGAGTIIGTNQVAKSLPDGYTLLLCSSTSFVNIPVFNKSITYDVERDFMGVSLVASSPMVLIVARHIPVQSVSELIRYAKSSQKPLTYASAGIGSSVHLAGELLQSMAGIQMLHVPYKSSAEASQAVLSGQVDLAFDIVLTSAALIQSKQLKGIATTGLRRIQLLPYLPTINESGLLGFNMTAWFGIAARKGTNVRDIDRLNQVLLQMFESTELKNRFAALGLDLAGSKPNELMALVRSEQQKLSQLIIERGIKLE